MRLKKNNKGGGGRVVLITWKLLGHNQNTAESEHQCAQSQVYDDHGAAWYDDYLAQHHKYPDDKHTQHVGATEQEEGEGEQAKPKGRNQLATVH